HHRLVPLICRIPNGQDELAAGKRLVHDAIRPGQAERNVLKDLSRTAILDETAEFAPTIMPRAQPLGRPLPTDDETVILEGARQRRRSRLVASDAKELRLPPHPYSVPNSSPLVPEHSAPDHV